MTPTARGLGRWQRGVAIACCLMATASCGHTAGSAPAAHVPAVIAEHAFVQGEQSKHLVGTGDVEAAGTAIGTLIAGQAGSGTVLLSADFLSDPAK